MCVCSCEHANGVLEMYKCINVSIHLKLYPINLSSNVFCHLSKTKTKPNKQSKNLDFNINKEANKSLGAAMQELYRPQGLATGAAHELASQSQ